MISYRISGPLIWMFLFKIVAPCRIAYDKLDVENWTALKDLQFAYSLYLYTQ